MPSDIKGQFWVKNNIFKSFKCQIGENHFPLLFALYCKDLENYLFQGYNGLQELSELVGLNNVMKIMIQ